MRSRKGWPGGVFPSQVAEPGIRRILADVPGNAPAQIPATFKGTQIIATGDAKLAEELKKFKVKLTEESRAKNKNLV